ncbi:MAG: hypothetical protein NWE89_16280 [Candidatus Bathyarchaeota archaeon]|nr:hypothetical protein [Candidatus Bathyarchaeota archaeon]
MIPVPKIKIGEIVIGPRPSGAGSTFFERHTFWEITEEFERGYSMRKLGDKEVQEKIKYLGKY